MTRKLQLLLTTLLLTIVGVTGAWAQQPTSVTLPTGDAWVNKESPTYNNNSNTVEVKTYGTTNNYYAVMQFSFDAPIEGYQVKSATLRLTTRYKKGDSEVKIYSLNTTVTDASTYETCGSAIETAIAGDALATIKLNGDGAKAPGDDLSNDSWKVVSAWQNTADLSTFVKGLGTNTFAIVIKKSYDQNNSSQIFSKEATDVTLKTSEVFKAIDLVPMLTVEYELKSGYEVATLTPSIDGWFRDANNNTANNYNGTTLETRWYKSGESETRFYGAMKFDIPAKPGYTVEDVAIRLVSERIKSDRATGIFDLGQALVSGNDYKTIGEKVTSAIAGSALGTFTAKGQEDKSPTNDNVQTVYQFISAWTNFVKLNKSCVDGKSSLSIVIAPTASNTRNQSTNYYTSEAANITFKDGATATAADIKPQLVITYKMMDSYTLKKNGVKAATLCLPFDATIPTGVTCYKLSHSDGSSVVHGTPVAGGTLSANTPVLVETENNDDYVFTRSGEITIGTTTYEQLTGTYTELVFGSDEGELAITEHFILNNHSTYGLGFYKAVDGKKVGAYRAYLTATNVPGAEARLSIVFDDEETTGIENLTPALSKGEGAYFDLSGRRVAQPTKGLYIVNGKKVVIK